MKKRIFGVILVVSIITSIITSIATTYVYYGLYVSNAKEQLKTIVSLSADPEKWENRDSIYTSVNDISKTVNYSIRFTIIQDSGEVIYDSWTDEIVENHKDRPEVAGAFEI